MYGMAKFLVGNFNYLIFCIYYANLTQKHLTSGCNKFLLQYLGIHCSHVSSTSLSNDIFDHTIKIPEHQ